MPPAKNKALIVGVSKYPKGYKDLPSVANDAKEVAKVLSSQEMMTDNGTLSQITMAPLTENCPTTAKGSIAIKIQTKFQTKAMLKYTNCRGNGVF